MDLLNVMELVAVNDARTEADRANGIAAAEKAQAAAVGAAVLAGKPAKDVQAAGEAALKAASENWRVWYEIEPDAVYPAAIAWLQKNAINFAQLANQPDKELFFAALNGDKAAAFIVQCRQFVPQNLLPLLPVGDRAWALAMVPRQEFKGDANDLAVREAALECARLFVTEVIHQATGRAIGLHISKSEAWKL